MFDRINKGLWWDRALTLVEGCTPVSPGCDNCWSAAMDHRFGKSTISVKTKHFSGKIICREDHLEFPLKTKKPTAWAVWNDLFHEDVPYDFIRQFYELSRWNGRHHIYIVLTKRPQRALWFYSNYIRNPNIDLSNVWLGVTAENQEQADKRIPILLQIPAAVHFVSVEPMLGELDMGYYLSPTEEYINSPPTPNLNLIG